MFQKFLALLFFLPLSLPVFSAPTVSPSVERYGVFEAAFPFHGHLENPFTQAELQVKFTGPGHQVHSVNGFYSGGEEWKVRFVPDRVGSGSYKAVLRTKGKKVSFQGSFACVSSPLHGFVRISKANPYRFQTEDGTPFYPIGQQVGWGVMPQVGFDGADGAKWRETSGETFLQAFDGATNLIRSQLGCGDSDGVALEILTGKEGLDRYDAANSQKLDQSCQAIKRHGWAQILILFQDISLWYNAKTAFGEARNTQTYKTLKSAHLKEMDAYIRYVVARWGAYVDIWEIFNEDTFAPDDFVAYLAQTVRDCDPYHHPITTNYERPREPWCEILSCHEYMNIPAQEVPGYLSKEFARLKSWGKPVLYTEFGNMPPLGNDDPVKWRMAEWTAFMNECGLGFWNMSERKLKVPTKVDTNPNNAYLGPGSRRHLRILADFTRGLPLDLLPVTPCFEAEQSALVWALADKDMAVLYAQHPKDPAKAKAGLARLWTGPGKFRVRWIDPDSGNKILEETRETEQNILDLPMPAFKADLAARLDRI